MPPKILKGANFMFVIVFLLKFCKILVLLVQVNKNAVLCKSIDDLFLEGRDAVKPDELNQLVKKVRCLLHALHEFIFSHSF